MLNCAKLPLCGLANSRELELTDGLALADVCQSIRHCLWEAGAVASLSRIAPRTSNPLIAATALDTLRAIFDDPLSRGIFCCDQGWEGAVREVMLSSSAPVALVAASRVVITASPDNQSFYRMLNICMPEAIVRMSTRVVEDPVIAAAADALLAMGRRGRLVSIQLLNFNLVHQMADSLGQVGKLCVFSLRCKMFRTGISLGQQISNMSRANRPLRRCNFCSIPVSLHGPCDHHQRCSISVHNVGS